MSLLRKIAIAATIATAAGCSSFPDYDVKRRAQPLVAENGANTPPQPQPRPRQPEVPEAPKVDPKYERIDLVVDYTAEDKQTAGLVRGYAALTGQTDIKAAFSADKDKNGAVSYEEISDAIVAYTKEHGGEVKLLPVKNGNVFKYSSTWVFEPGASEEYLKMFSKENAYGKMQLLDNWEKKAKESEKK